MSLFGFKEWKLICDVLETGSQSVILRKGGISEGKRGFQWLHREFFLFPTYFHEQADQLNLGEDAQIPDIPTKEADEVEIRLFAEIEETWEIDSLETALSLQDLHTWQPQVIEERFGYGENDGISLALLKVHRLAAPWTLANRKGFGGCRSWLGLPEEEGLPGDWRKTCEQVVADARIAEIRSELTDRLGSK